jgi:hypothetical protein
MKRKTRRRITEIRQIALVVDSASESGSHCPVCGDSRLVSPLLAAQICETDTRAIYRLIEARRVHFVETAGRQLFVCLGTLADAVKQSILEKKI